MIIYSMLKYFHFKQIIFRFTYGFILLQITYELHTISAKFVIKCVPKNIQYSFNKRDKSTVLCYIYINNILKTISQNSSEIF